MTLQELETLIREQADSVAMHATAIAEGKIPRDGDGGALRLVAKARQIKDLSNTLMAWVEDFQKAVVLHEAFPEVEVVLNDVKSQVHHVGVWMGGPGAE